MTQHNDTTTNPSTSSTAKKVLLALGLGAAAVAVAVTVVSLTGDSDESAADAAVETTATEPAPEASVTAPVETEPADDASVATEAEVPTSGTAVSDQVDDDVDEPVAEPVEAPAEPVEPARPVPTIVIGQDENGEDIIVEIEISEVCATTFHQPLDADSLSFIRWEYDAPGLAVDTPISIEGSDGFSQFTKVTVDQQIIVEQGISSYGEYDFPTAGWTDGDVDTSIDPDGTHIVDDREGEASITCLS